MAIEGNLGEMSLPTLVQLVLQEGGQAHIKVTQADNIGHLYLVDGELQHGRARVACEPGGGRTLTAIGPMWLILPVRAA